MLFAPEHNFPTFDLNKHMFASLDQHIQKQQFGPPDPINQFAIPNGPDLTHTLQSPSLFRDPSIFGSTSSTATSATTAQQLASLPKLTLESIAGGSSTSAEKPDPFTELWGKLQPTLPREALSRDAFTGGLPVTFPNQFHFLGDASLPDFPQEEEAKPLTTSVPLTLSRTQQLFAQKMAAEEAFATQIQATSATTGLDTNPFNPSAFTLGPTPCLQDKSATSLSEAAKLAWAQSMPAETIEHFNHLSSLSTVVNRDFASHLYAGATGTKMPNTDSSGSSVTGSGKVAEARGSSDSVAPPSMSPAAYRSATLEQGALHATPSPSVSAAAHLPLQQQQQQQQSQGQHQQSQGQQNFLQPNQPYRKPTQQSLYFQQLIAAKLGQLNAPGQPGADPAAAARGDFGSDTWTPDARQMDSLPSSRSPLYAVSGGTGSKSSGSAATAPYNGGSDPSATFHGDRSHNFPPYSAPANLPSSQQQQQQQQQQPPQQQQQQPAGQFGSYPPAPGSYPGYPDWAHAFSGQYPGGPAPHPSTYRGQGGNEMVTDFWGRTVTRPAPQGSGPAYQEWGNNWAGQQQQHHPQHPHNQQQHQQGRPMSSGGGRGPGSLAGTPTLGQGGFPGGPLDRRPSMEASSRAPPGFATGSGGETIIVPDLTDAGVNSTPWSGTLPAVYGQSIHSDGDRDGDLPKKATLACHFCRGRKLRCDGAKPTCSHCVKRGLSCSYDTVIRRRGPGRHKKADKVAAALAATEANGGIVPPEYEAILNPKTKQPKVAGQSTGAKRGRKSKAEKEALALAGMGYNGDDVKGEGSVSGDEGEGISGDDGHGFYGDAGSNLQDPSARSYASGDGMGYAALGPPTSNPMHSGYSYPNPYQNNPYPNSHSHSPHMPQSSWNPIGVGMGSGHGGRERPDEHSASSIPAPLLGPGPSQVSGRYYQPHLPPSMPHQQHPGMYTGQEHQHMHAPPSSTGSGNGGRARSPSNRDFGEEERESKRMRV